MEVEVAEEVRSVREGYRIPSLMLLPLWLVVDDDSRLIEAHDVLSGQVYPRL